MADLTVVVAGATGLAGRLARTGRFTTVHDLGSTGGLKDLIGSGRLGGDPSDRERTAFIFADDVNCDTPEVPVGRIVQFLTSRGWKVLLLAVTPNAVELGRANPAAGLLDGPYSINSVLAALSGLGITVEPAEDGFEPFDIKEKFTPAAVRPAEPAAASAGAGGWMTVPAAGSAPEVPEPPTRPAQPGNSDPGAAGAADGWAQVPQRPAAGAPAAGGAAASSAPAFTPTPSFPTQQPQQQGGWPQTAPQTAPQAAPGGWPQTAPQAAPGGWPQTAPQAAPGGWPQPGTSAQQAPVEGYGTPAARVGSYQAERQPAMKRRGHVIVVTAPKGGTGKSSLSLNLTSYLGLRLRPAGRRVCIVDTNFQQADTGKYLNVFSPNITSILKDPTTLTRDRIEQQLVHKPELGFSALLGPALGRDANPQWINARLYNQILPLLQEHYDYIIVDTPVAELFHDIHRDFALPNADFILVPITPNLPTLLNVDRWLHEICQPVHVSGGAGVDRNKVGIVLNRAKDTVGLSFEDVQTELSQWRIVGVIPETDEWQRANNENALVATRNYQELNNAFSQVLYAATDETLLLEGTTAIASPNPGFLARLFGRRGR